MNMPQLSLREIAFETARLLMRLLGADYLPMYPLDPPRDAEEYLCVDEGKLHFRVDRIVQGPYLRIQVLTDIAVWCDMLRGRRESAICRELGILLRLEPADLELPLDRFGQRFLLPQLTCLANKLRLDKGILCPKN